MCGIFARVSTSPPPKSQPEGLLEGLKNRGPDLCGSLDVTPATSDEVPVHLHFTSTVLALRGDHVARQPLQDPSSKSILSWNGEAWKIGKAEIATKNDGEEIIQLLAAAATPNDANTSIEATMDVLRSISGPFAFVYFDSIHQLIYFGRDCLGRRSLLYNGEDDPSSVLLASIAGSATGAWKEVEADGIYVLTLSLSNLPSLLRPVDLSAIPSTTFPIYRMPWTSDDKQGGRHVPSLPLGSLNAAVPLPDVTPVLDLESPSVARLQQRMDESLRLRVLNIPNRPSLGEPAVVKLAVLFSGGLDCTVLARMAHDILPADKPIDLLNVAFENPRVVAASKQAPKVSKKTGKMRKAAARNSSDMSAIEEGTSTLASPAEVVELSPYESCPDRMTGRAAHAELLRVCPGRTFRFVAVNVPYTEFVSHKQHVINLIYPHNTEMDLSIAAALYFASRGVGLASNTTEYSDERHYTTSARVLLSGLGADELFGGYTRHGTAYSRHGFRGLIEELELDVSRLGKRNLGRDDRAISNWSHEVRFPFLDEDLVTWALKAPVWEKTGFGTVDGGETKGLDDEKKVLRLLAWKLGLKGAAGEKKRAIQFGARTAKMETGRSKGTTLVF